MVRASLASGARDSLLVVVHPLAINPILEERWDATWLSRWRRFGTPQSMIVRHGAESAFWNAGDGSYFSGVYSKTSYRTDEGLAIDALLSTPITREKWQKMYVGFLTLDGAALSRWDHQSGYLPGLAGGLYCALDYPSDAEGSQWGAGYAVANQRTLATHEMRSGKDYRVRIQIFPDGRCGMALNGRAMIVGMAAGPTMPVRLIVYGSSVDTKMLAKHLTVTRGVATGVDWGKLMK
jgi:hypothetical protein